MYIPHYDTKADRLPSDATAEEKGRFERSHNGYGWMLFYKELYPDLSVPYMRWDGKVIDSTWLSFFDAV